MVKNLLKEVGGKISQSIKSRLGREITGLHEAAYLLAGSALLSQILALFRDRILAATFGATTNLDLYYSAFRIPDLIFAILGSLVSASVIMPFFMEREKQGHEEARDFFSNIFYFYFFSIALVSIIVCIFASPILRLLFPSFAHTAQFSTLVWMMRIMLLSPIFLGLSNLFSTISQAYRRFYIYSLSPIIYNVGIIFGIVVLYPMFGLVGLAIGVSLGALLHFAVQVPFAIKHRITPRFTPPHLWGGLGGVISHVKTAFTGVKKALLISIPRTITVSSNEITELFLVSFASFLLPGSISIFNFSFNLQSVPFSIIGVSYSMAVFPTLARHFSTGKHTEFVEEMVASSRHIIFWSISVSVMFIVLRAQIVRVILGAGQFNWNDTRLTAAALAIFTVSLIAQNMTMLFIRSYYSRGKTRTPLTMNMISSVVMVLVSYLLVHFFNHAHEFQYFMESILKVDGVPGTVVLMLPLGYSIGTLLNMALHWWDFHREFKSYSRRVLRTLFQVCGASLIMGYVTYVCLNFFGTTAVNTAHTFGIFLQGFLAGIVGIIVGIIVLLLLKNEEIQEIWKTAHSKVFKSKQVVIGPDATMD